MFYGLLSLVILVLDILAIIQVIQSSLDSGMKILWVLIILFLPLIGMILWYTIGGGSLKAP